MYICLVIQNYIMTQLTNEPTKYPYYRKTSISCYKVISDKKVLKVSVTSDEEVEIAFSKFHFQLAFSSDSLESSESEFNQEWKKAVLILEKIKVS